MSSSTVNAQVAASLAEATKRGELTVPLNELYGTLIRMGLEPALVESRMERFFQAILDAADGGAETPSDVSAGWGEYLTALPPPSQPSSQEGVDILAFDGPALTHRCERIAVPYPTSTTVPVCTNRRPADGQFTADRTGMLHGALCPISLPASRPLGGGSRGSRIWDSKVIGVEEMSVRHTFRAAEATAKRLHPNAPAIVIYVHGFNITFDDAILAAAHLSEDLHTGVIAFSWPAIGSVLSYGRDVEMMTASQLSLARLLVGLRRVLPDVRLHLLGHSLGTRCLLGALRYVRLIQPRIPRFQQLVLAAPDVSVEWFGEVAQHVMPLVSRATVYASWADKALRLSARLHQMPRVGASPSNAVRGVDVIWVLSEGSWPFRHDYISSAPLLHDVSDLLMHGTPAAQRVGLVERRPPSGPSYWLFRN